MSLTAKTWAGGPGVPGTEEGTQGTLVNGSGRAKHSSANAQKPETQTLPKTAKPPTLRNEAAQEVQPEQSGGGLGLGP